MKDHNHGYFYPLIFPFYQKNWVRKTWWLCLIAVVPMVDLILLSGWRLNLIKRIVRNENEILPTADIVSFFKGGLVLWLFGISYVLVPFLLIMSTGTGELGAIIEIVKWLANYLTGTENTLAWHELLNEQGTYFVIRTLIEIAWLLVSMPIYRMGMLRYAITGKVGCFINIPLNAYLALKYGWKIILMWVFGVFMVAFVMITTTILAATVIFAVLAPIFGLLVYYWATGYEYGHLAQEMKKTESSEELTAIEEGTT